MGANNGVNKNQDDRDELTLAPDSDFSLNQVSSQSALKHETVMPICGTMIDEYEVVEEIDRGAMGVVYRARHKSLGRNVAIKVLLEHEFSENSLRQRFDMEARAAASLDHPGIVPIFDVGQWKDRPYFSMALIEGPCLADLLRDGPLTCRQSAEIAKEVSEAIKHAHQHEIIHRDLKPANILIDPSGNARITDFGVSKILGASNNATQCGEIIGTPHYMPPEQAGEFGFDVGPHSDIYSIGALLFSMLTGRPPFQAASPVEVMAQVVTQQPVAPSALNSNVPVELEIITLKCLSKDPQDRYSIAADLTADLNRYLLGEPILAKAPGLIQQAKVYVHKHILFASVSGTIALLLVMTSIAVFVSLVSSRLQVTELKTQLNDMREQLTAERLVAKHFIGSLTTSDKSTHVTSFEVNRLTSSAKRQLENNRDLAMQLALAAIEIAIDQDQDPPGEMLTLLNKEITKERHQHFEGDDAPYLNIEQIIKESSALVKHPLTAAERERYGLKSN